jgi:hypothetical protein
MACASPQIRLGLAAHYAAGNAGREHELPQLDKLQSLGVLPATNFLLWLSQRPLNPHSGGAVEQIMG